MVKEFKEGSSYTWNSDDNFTLKGNEIELFNLLIRLQQSKPEYKEFQLIQRASGYLTEIFKRNIDVLEEPTTDLEVHTD